MNIGIDGRAAIWYRGTGIGTYTHELIKELDGIDSSDDFTVYFPNHENVNKEFKNLKFKFSKGEKERNFWESINNPLDIDRGEYDLFHVPQNGMGFTKFVNNVITLHDVIPLKMPETVSENYMRIFNENIDKIMQNTKGIITVSNHSKKDIVDSFNYDENKIFVTYLAPEKRYVPIEKNICKKYIKSKYGIKEKYILYVGGFSPRKNINELIESFYLLRKNHKEDIKLVIAGQKGLSFKIYEDKVIRANLVGEVIFPGFIPVTDLPYLYNGAECFVYPSLYEGFGLPPLEAMACKVPVIISNLTSLKEIFLDNAILFDPFVKNDLYYKLLYLLEDEELKSKIAIKGYDYSKQFSFEKTAKMTIDAYHKIVTCK